MFDSGKFAPVLPSQIDAARPHLTDLLNEFERETWLVSAEDVFQQAAKGDAQIWVYHDGEKFRGLVVSRVFTTSLGKICNLWVCIGHDCEELIAGAYEQIERWARDAGCHELEIVGRKGWLKLLPGFRQKAVVLSKIIAERH